MGKRKIIKSAAAVALGASVVTTAVAPGVASAATKYKVNSKGNLVLKSTGSLVKGWVEFGGKLYKNGKPAPAKKYKIMGTGASMKLYFGPTLKKGYKTANSKSLLFKDGKLLKGNKQTADRARYYENGKLATGWDVVAADETKYIYKSGKLFKEQKTATRDGVLNYFENGKLAEGTKAFQDTLFTDGTVDEKDQVFKDVLYVGGKKAEGTVTFEDVVYVDGVKDTEKPEITAEDKTVEYGSEAVDVATLATVKDNSGEEIKAEAKISFDGKAVEKIDTKTPGVYTVTFTAKDKNGNEAEAKEVKVTVAEAAKAEVESVKAINGKQLKVTFNKSVEADSLIATDGTLVNNVLKMEKVAATSPSINLDVAKAELAEDGRTLTITYDGNEYAEGDYVFSVVKNKVQTTNKATVEYIPAYTSSTINIKDTVAPTLEATKKINATQYKLTFSKPVKGLGAITAKYADGTDLTGTAAVTHVAESVAVDNNSIIVTLANTTVGKDVNVQIVGITDYSGNIVSPNPVAFTAVAGAKDGIAPTFNVTAESATTLTVKFSEEVQSFNKSEFKIDTGALSTHDRVIQDETDKTKYTIKLATPLTAGFHNIAVAANKFLDLTGEGNAEHASTIQIKADQVAPVLSSSKVVKERDGKEYLYVTFDKDVQLAGLNGALTGLTGKSVKNYVTDKTVTFNTAAFTPVDGSKKEYKLDLASITTGSAPTTALENGVTYTIDLPATAVKTLTGTPNDLQKGAITFVKGSDSAITPLEVAEVKTNRAGYDAAGSGSPDASLKNNQVTVKFAQVVDGASATKASNYTIDGAVVKTAELGTDKKTVTLTLEDGKTTYSGARYLTINNVTTTSGVALESTFKKAITLNENIAPTVTGAVVKSVNTTTAPAGTATVELTFTEAITTANLDTLSVFVDGVNDTGVTVANAAATNQKTLTVTINLDNVAKLTNKVITLKANGTSNTIVDAAGNTANIGVVTVK